MRRRADPGRETGNGKRETKAKSRPGAIRISAGKWKGRALEVPAGARPTSARAREALFDILAAKIPGARVLDLYAGSGAIGLEALSRGASGAVLVDHDAAAARRNADRVGAGASVELYACDAAEALERLERRGERFDVVFSDPPYGLPTAAAAKRCASVLAPDGVLVLQGDAGPAPPAPAGLTLASERPYGRNVFRIYTLEGTGAVSR